MDERLMETLTDLISTFSGLANEEERAIAYTIGHDALYDGIDIDEVDRAFCTAVRTLVADCHDRMERQFVSAAARELRADLLAPYSLVA